MDIICLDHLTKFYGKSRGITDITFSIKEGEVFGFIGPNGAGKSTTIRILLALIQPTRGAATIKGMDCIKQSKTIKKSLGYVPSEVNYYDDMTVKDILKYSAKFYHMDCSKRLKNLADRFELDIKKKINALSYGNKKKVAIIQALLHDPEILIFDEPTGGLDPLMQNIFFECLEEEQKNGKTILFSSHILNEVQRMCDRVAIIKEGNLLKLEHIDTLRKSCYKNIKLEFEASEKNKEIEIEGITNYSIKDNKVEFLFNGNMNQLLSVLSKKAIGNLWAEEPSLEEVFMHYYEKEDNNDNI